MNKLVSVGMAVVLIGFAGGTPKTPPQVASNVSPVAPAPAQNISTNETISPNTTASNVSQNETPMPWPNRDVFSDATIAINVTVGQEFVIGYNWYNNLFAGFPTIF